MIQEFINEFFKKECQIRTEVADLVQKGVYISYVELVEILIGNLSDASYRYIPDPERIHIIDDGDYLGTLLFVVSDKRRQPSVYFSLKVYYGSCSYCDTLKGILEESDEELKVKLIMTEILHLVQSIKEI